MEHSKLKKVFAREALIFLGFAFISVLFVVLLFNCNKDNFIFKFFPTDYYFVEVVLPPKLAFAGGFLLLGAYPLFLFVRFIIWAFKTVREK